MSHEAVTWAFDDAPMLRMASSGKRDTTARSVLVALAERADAVGANSHPSLLDVCYRTGFDRKTVREALRRLEAAGLITRDGTVGGCTRWRLAMDKRRPPEDREELEREEDAKRAKTAERVRRHRATKAVTPPEGVTVTPPSGVTTLPVTHLNGVTSLGVTPSGGVTEPGVTPSDSVRNAENSVTSMAVTPFKGVCNAVSSTRTIHEPSVLLTVLEPPGSGTPPPSESPPDQTTIDGQLSHPPSKPKARSRTKPKIERTPEQQAAFEAADKIAKWWWDARCPNLGIPVKSKSNRSPKASFPGFRAFLESYLTADPPCSPQEVQQALETCRQSWPSDLRFEAVIRDAREKAPPPPNNRPVDFKQQATNDLFDQALQRARARDAMEAS
ncbi:helix-turn-helix domain-containing protein [Thermomonospora umbrina]|uniref:Regulatory GntR family protein n=1 Tax=Thermomonospora umbrina TaxID=111806 RepID=A0A3D9SXH6_9ACTN|nr:helix-turn-helix domain-containing protein [Thermomonospora umbrina]REF00268.1 regulatory GntR family protein [Thermomonospora umbrina]